MDPFDAPSGGDPVDSVVRDQAASTLYKTAGAAVGLGLLQWCCNPVFIVTFFAAGASVQALRQPGWMRIAMEEDYPEGAGTISMIAGVIGLLLVALRLLVLALQLLGLAVNLSDGQL